MVDAFMHPKLLISLSLVREWVDFFTGSTYSLPSLWPDQLAHRLAIKNII
jgi:hypothetical protein